MKFISKKTFLYALYAILLVLAPLSISAQYATSLLTGPGAPSVVPSPSKKEGTVYYDYTNRRLYGLNGSAWEQKGVEFANGVPSNGIDTKIKFVVDTLNNIVYVRKNGVFTAISGGGINAQSIIDTIKGLSNTAQAFEFPMRNYAAKYADVILEVANSSLKIAHFGDSNTEVGLFEAYFKGLMKVVIKQKGAGWVSLNTSNPIVSAVTRTSVGFSNKTITDNTVSGIDLYYVTSNASTDSCILNFPNSITTKDNSTFTNATIYASGTGTFTASIADGTPVVYTLSASVQAFNIVVTEGRYKLAIKAGGAGQHFYGVAFNCTSPSFTYYRLGASGRTFKEFATLNQAALTTQLGGISPNLILIQLGSNDFVEVGATANSIMNNVRTFVNKVKIASPLSDLMFLIPTDRGDVAGTTLEKSFADSLTFYCIQNKYNFIDLHKTYGVQSEAATLGYFGDGVHFTAKGHTLNAKMVSSRLFETEDRNSWKRTGSNAEFLYFDTKNEGGVQIGRSTATGGYLDVYNPLTGNLLTLQGNSNSYISLATSGLNSMGLQVIDGNFARVATTLPFRIYDNTGLKYDSGGGSNTFYGTLGTTGTIYGPAYTNGNALFGVDYVVDIAANNTKKPVRFQNMPVGNSLDSVVTSSGGELRRIAQKDIVNNAMSSNCAAGIGTIGAITAASTSFFDIAYGKTITSPHVLVNVEQSGSAILTFSLSALTTTTARVYVSNLNVTGDAAAVKVHYRVCPNSGVGF